jgi:hypothetical protein
MGLRNIIAKRDQTQTSLGNPLAGGLVFLYEPGTTTFIQSFSNFELTTAHESPVKLSGSGRANIWINQDCDIRIEDRNGNLILTEDNANPDGLTSSDDGTNLISNPSFESDTDADGTPDSWTLVNDPASTNARDTSESTDGAASFRFTSAGSGGGTLTTTNFFPVNGVDNLQVNFDIRSTDATVKNIVRVEWYDISQVAISNTDVYDSVTNPTAFESQKIAAIPPATARFAKIKLIGIDPSVVKTGSTFFDNLNVFYPITSSGIFDNVTIQNNEIITTNVDGDLELNPNGVGSVKVKNDLDVVGDVLTDATLKPLGDTASGDAAAVGYTATRGIIIQGQGSLNDVTIKNDASAAVIQIPTGTTTVKFTTGISVGAATAQAGGVAFPATAVAVSDVNTLDDYEEGTFTPVTSPPATSYTVQGGDNTKIGDRVYFNISLVINLIGSGGTTTIGGLPFTIGGNTHISAVRATTSATSIVSITARLPASGNVINLRSRTAASASDGSNAIFQDSTTVEVSGFYGV